MALKTYLVTNDLEERHAWDQFVRSSSDGTVFHLIAWRRVVEDVFRHSAHYLMAADDGVIHAVLPLFEVWGLLAGHVLISVPYGVYGGLCGADPVARALLIDEARNLSQRRKVRYVEFRHLYGPVPGLPTTSFFDTLIKPMDANPEVNFGAIPRKRRAMIRQGIRHGLETRQGWEPLAEFYDIYARNRRRLGSPPFSRRLFEAIRIHFGDEAQLLTVWRDGRMVGGVISFFYQGRVMPYYGAALPEAYALAPNDFMYWKLMSESCQAGFRLFDFGQSHSGSGSYHFKLNWGFRPEPLSYQYLLSNGCRMPNNGPLSSHLRPFVSVWKHLPLPVTKWIGPALTRRLPLH
jgi:FemAB-related protein (PEP-CTERM system-associated)